ncbi:hypothetical protein CRUP_003273, partial [Coryphaenoides rupestris]
MFKNVFGSGFLVRTAHVILTWVVTLILFLHDTDLRKQEEDGQLVQPVLFVLLVLVSVLLYFAVSLMDPGFILSDDNGLQPMRSKHCQTCQHCVRRYDHHCPWIENCVGERNHRWFVLYLAVQLLFMSRHRISYLRHCGADENPFDRGAARNLWGFFCVVGGGGVVWEQVYFREGSDP